MIRVRILDCGSTTVDESLPFSDKSKNPMAFTGILRGRKHQVEVPVTAYLIEHPKGLILIDTGWDPAVRTHAKEYEGLFNYFASPGKLPAGKAVTEHLQRLGYSADDIDTCILTHMDIDHAGGIGLVRDAKRILASEAEYSAAAKWNPRYLKRLWKEIDIQTFPDTEFDLFRDGSITLLPLHGHSAGMTGVKVQGESGNVIIAGDCGYGSASWERLVLPGILWNKSEVLASLKKLQGYAKDTRCKGILMTHDPENMTGIIDL